MGQGSSQEGTESSGVPLWLQARVQKHAGDIKQLVSLSYNDFVASIQDLNKM